MGTPQTNCVSDEHWLYLWATLHPLGVYLTITSVLMPSMAMMSQRVYVTFSCS